MVVRTRIIAVVVLLLSLVPSAVFCQEQTGNWFQYFQSFGYDGPTLFGSLPGEGPFSEVASASVSWTLGGFEWGDYDLPMPIYTDAAEADPSEIFFTIMITDANLLLGGAALATVRYTPGSGTVYLMNDSFADQTTFAVTVFALRPVATSVPSGSRVPATLGTVKAILGESFTE